VRMALRTKEIREPRRVESEELNLSKLDFIRAMYGLLRDTPIIWGCSPSLFLSRILALAGGL